MTENGRTRSPISPGRYGVVTRGRRLGGERLGGSGRLSSQKDSKRRVDPPRVLVAGWARPVRPGGASTCSAVREEGGNRRA